eukprot:TRINITY_DN17220_c0_g1_i1.p1 TRINITY_DN17220_c0_g1~~TRINITY_DN17220_c0_g1_i1.p1  ORF type:complete len:134 (+),score=15.93 TRINITY_DN17220_c0_g1_i1:149-550(+)
MVKESTDLPVIGNGHCLDYNDVKLWKQKSNVNGVMSARGILANPALFAGFPVTPQKCVAEWLDISLQLGFKTHLIHQHLMFMLFNVNSRVEKSEFNSLDSIPGILQYFEKRGIEIESLDLSKNPMYKGPLLDT